MPRIKKSFQTIVKEIRRDLSTSIPNASTESQSFIREAVINPVSTQLSQGYNELDVVSSSHLLEENSGSDLDSYASNVDIFRRPARHSRGELFVALDALASGVDITVPSGTTVSTASSANSRPVNFTTTTAVTFSPDNQARYEALAQQFRPLLDQAGLMNVRMVGRVNIRAVVAGNTGNVGAFTIKIGNIRNINHIINLTPTRDGFAAESDESLRNRISLERQGSAAGTEASYLSTAFRVPSITAVSVVGGGDQAMVRDGTIYDNNGNLITEGSGQAVDVWVLGSDIASERDVVAFVNKNTGTVVDSSNKILLGSNGLTATQPIVRINSVTGTESGANFIEARIVADSEGNEIYEGNYFLLKDSQASQFKLVKDNLTGKIKFARNIVANSTRYTIQERLSSSLEANSVQGQDSLFWISDEITINNEVITRGSTLEGVDNLVFNDVLKINEISQEIEKTDYIVIGDQRDFEINTKHTPVLEVYSVEHTRLGTKYEHQLIDANTGKIKLTGRFAPQNGDVLKVKYLWHKHYIKPFEYSLVNDRISWIEDINKSSNPSITLLANTKLEEQLTLGNQPKSPTFIEVALKDLPERTKYTTLVLGQSGQIKDSQRSFVSSNLELNNLGNSLIRVPLDENEEIARVLRVRNSTKNFDYNLSNLTIQNNAKDSSKNANILLKENEFILSQEVNDTKLSSGDRILFSRKAATKQWSSQLDFLNNIDNNKVPVFDELTTSIQNNGEIQIRSIGHDESITPTYVSGTITEDTVWSGLIEVIGDVLIPRGVVVTIAPSTYIRVRDASQLTQASPESDPVEFNSSAYYKIPSSLSNDTSLVELKNDTDISDFYFIYQRPQNVSLPYAVLVNANGKETRVQYNKDVVSKTRSGSSILYKVNNTVIDSSFGAIFEESFDPDTTLDTKATFIGCRSAATDKRYIAPLVNIKGITQYVTRLSSEPTIVNNQRFIFLRKATDPDQQFGGFTYDDTYNVLFVDETIDVESDNRYIVDYDKFEEKKIKIQVEGTLRSDSNTGNESISSIVSSAINSAPGDWSGLSFILSNADSNLNYLRIRDADTGISIVKSDIEIDNCQIQECLNEGVRVNDAQLQQTLLTDNNNLLMQLRGSAFDAVDMVRFELAKPVFTASGLMPKLVLIEGDRYYVELDYNVDYSVRIGTQNQKFAIDSTLLGNIYGPLYAAESPNLNSYPNGDFAIEFDAKSGSFYLAFYKTSRLHNALLAEGSGALRGDSVLGFGFLSLEIYSTHGTTNISNTLISNTGSGITLDKLSNSNLSEVTIDAVDKYGIYGQNAFSVVRNSVFTNYGIAGVVHDGSSLITINHMNCFSKSVEKKESIGTTDTTILARSINESTKNLIVLDDTRLHLGQVIEIDEEFMRVDVIQDSHITVSRGINSSVAASHRANSTILIFEPNVVFTVTGIPEDNCQLVEVDNSGTPRPNIAPIEMRAIAANTFRTSFPVSNRSSYSYIYQYTDSALTLYSSPVKTIPAVQFAKGVNDIYNVAQLHQNNDSNNISIDSKFQSRLANNYNLEEDSLLNAGNDFFGEVYIAQASHRYIGSSSVTEEVVAQSANGEIFLEISNEPLVVETIVNEAVVVLALNTAISAVAEKFVKYENSNYAGKIVLLNGNAGSMYRVTYNVPTSLGAEVNPYPDSTKLVYTFSQNKIVDFTQLTWTENKVGEGNIRFSARVADDISDLSESELFTSEEQILFLGQTGKAIEVTIELFGNHRGFNKGDYIFPKLRDFSLRFVPIQDTQEYEVLSVRFDARKNLSLARIDRVGPIRGGISVSTFEKMGTDNEIDVIIRRKDKQFNPLDDFALATCIAPVTGDTEIQIRENVTFKRTLPLMSDVLYVDLVTINKDDSELFVFIEDSKQLTEKRFWNINSITTFAEQDGRLKELENEQISVKQTNQALPDSSFVVSYDYLAPKEGESILIDYDFNRTVQQVQNELDEEQQLTANALAREAIDVEVRIEALIQISESADLTSSISSATERISQHFSQLAFFDAVIEEQDIRDILLNTVGITSVQLKTLNKKRKSGLVETIRSSKAERLVLEIGYPIISGE